MNEQPIRWWRTELGADEADAVARAIADRRINRGSVCARLEQELADRLGFAHVLLTSSGSAAIALALQACGVGPGDEVIVPAATFIATAHAPRLLGATVRLADVRPDRPLLDPVSLEAAITPRTRAVIPVHLGGGICDMPAILAVARRHGLAVVEDCAQALGSRRDGRSVGTAGRAGAFSMSIAKLITTGEGGFVGTDDPDLHDRLHRLHNQGVRVIFDNVYDAPGFNLRFNDLLAAVGIVQVGRLPEKIAAVRRVREFYARELADLPYLRMLPVDLAGGELPAWSQVLCADRDRVVRLLAERGIQTRPIYPCLADSPHLGCPGAFPRARHLCARVLTLPSGPDQRPADLERVVDTLHEIAPLVGGRVEPAEEPVHG